MRGSGTDATEQESVGLVSLLTIVSSIASVIAIPLAIYFYVQSDRYRELTYFVHPVKTIVVSTGESSELTIRFGESEVKENVTAAQVAFWNAGSESIRPENILEPFTIQTGNAPILEARILKRSREVIGLSLDRSELGQGQLGILWTILEQGDGGIVQVLYAGSEDVPVTARATIEGQPELDSLYFPGRILSQRDQYESQLRREGGDFWFYLAGGLILLAIIITPARTEIWKLKSLSPLRDDWMIILAAFASIARAFFVLFRTRSGPPFDF